jgi:calcineurin-like phosphoesterase family protein
MSKVLATSDNHYNHDNIIIHSKRPFANVTEMNEHMIAAWNAVVDPEDTVYCMGDFAFKWRGNRHVTYDELGERLNGLKHLIIGNHDLERNDADDDGTDKIKDHWMWESVQSYLEIKFGKSRFVLFHYPIETWRNAHKGWYHLHGHCHGTLKRVIPHRIDMGVDCWPNYAPVNLEHVRDILAAQENYLPQDHHGDPDKVTKYEN